MDSTGHPPMELADRGVSSLSCRPPGQQRAHEGPFVPQHAAALVTDAIGVDEIGICAEQRPVLLAGGEAGRAEQGQGWARAVSLAPSAGRK
jgi:hypothetical protein